MASVEVLDVTKKAVGKTDLPDSVFSVPIKKNLFWEVVRQQMAGRRAGTHSSKTRAQVSGGGRKPYRQKGTGNARQGTIRAPQFRHGGVVFGPTPRSYAFAVPKKVRRQALASALSLRNKEGRLLVIDKIEMTEPKTKKFVEILSALGVEKSTLIVTREKDVIIEKSARNLYGVKVLPVEGVNVYDLLRHENLVLLKDSVDGLKGRLGS